MQTTTNYGLKKPEGNEFISIEDLNDNADEIDRLLEERLKKTGDASNTTNTFSQASTRVNLSTGEKISFSLGKIMKWFTDLKNVAFSGKASDLEQDSNNRLVTDTEKSSWSGKVDASSGDIQNTKVGTFTASSASWPVPAAGETVKVILGKIVKYFTDLNSWRSTVVLIANIVNNCTSTDTNKPLSANQGKVLMDGKAPKSHASTATTYGAGNASNYGHVKVSDNYTSSAGAASAGVAASSKAVADAYAKLNSDISNSNIYKRSYDTTITLSSGWNRISWGHVYMTNFTCGLFFTFQRAGSSISNGKKTLVGTIAQWDTNKVVTAAASGSNGHNGLVEIDTSGKLYFTPYGGAIDQYETFTISCFPV